MVIPHSSTATFQRAVVRSLAHPVRVEILNWERREFAVSSATKPGMVYAVKLFRSTRGNEAACSCAARDYCRHIHSAVLLFRAVTKSRILAGKGEA